MTHPLRPSVAHLSDDDLVSEVKRLAGCVRDVTAELIAHLAELDARRLYLGAGFSSLFAYCTAVLRLSEHEAYNRIEAARAARKFPLVLDRLRDGSVNLSAVRLLAPHLTSENHEELLASAAGRTRRGVEELLVRRFPRPLVPSSVRKLPSPSPVPSGAPGRTLFSHEPAATRPPAPDPLPAPPRRALLVPLTPDRYKITFTARAETCEKLRQAQELLSHQVPDGNLAEVFDRALSALVVELTRKKLAATPTPRPARTTAPGSRHIPAAVKRAVWARDRGRCAFVSRSGRRCEARAFLEFHHADPHALGGEPTVRNIALRCRAHNGYEAELVFGPRRTATRSGTSSPSVAVRRAAANDSPRPPVPPPRAPGPGSPGR